MRLFGKLVLLCVITFVKCLKQDIFLRYFWVYFITKIFTDYHQVALHLHWCIFLATLLSYDARNNGIKSMQKRRLLVNINRFNTISHSWTFKSSLLCKHIKLMRESFLKQMHAKTDLKLGLKYWKCHVYNYWETRTF